MFINLIYISVLLPFIGFIFNSFFGRKIKNEKIIGSIGSTAIIISFIFVLLAFIETLNLPAENRSNIVTLFTWLKVSNLDVSFGYQVDPLSLLMGLIVTGVGSLIHIYSIGYMHGDKGFWRFFAYLNLFIFSMMNLILADNFLLLFLGWEGVGLCSYLLIGFWYDRKFEKSTTSDAAKKAFVVNRIGDFGFLLGMFLIYMTFGSLKFNEVFLLAANSHIPEITITLITLFLFIGATGKSAQIPLYVWLPDAMAGPTPVSALIHAATMVTAGVYMLSRCSVLFVQSEVTMTIVAFTGAFTALAAATMGLVQNDIKKILAYSTVSQLGLMFLAAGVGAFGASIFHVMTHAFFKALLFLGAGSVIHAMHEEQDIKNMGGLKKYLPKTFVVFIIAFFAISGIPPFSGFFSKDEILWKAFSQGSSFLYVIGLVTALLTAFYTTRLIILTFFGNPRWNENKKPHESPDIMLVPLYILAFLSALGGFLGIPAVIGGEKGNLLENWLHPIYAETGRYLVSHGEHSHLAEIVLMILSVAVALLSIYAGYTFYTKNIKPVDFLIKKFSKFYKLVFNKYYIDEIYEKAIIIPVKNASEKILWKFTDVKVIDGFINKTAESLVKISSVLRLMQTGVSQFYAVIISAGIIILFIFLFF